MTLIVDAAPLIALADRRDERRETVRGILREERQRWIVPAPVTAEVDYLLGTRVGSNSQRRFLQDAADEVFEVACLEAHDYETALDLDTRYQDLRLGLADLSIIILARRYRTRRVLTFDGRHFAAVEPLQGGRFELLPG